MRQILFAVLIATNYCGNPAIHRYLIYETTKNGSAKTENLQSGLELQKSPRIILEAAKAEELDALADSLGIGIEQKYYRLPPISIFRFKLENETTSPQTFNFSDCEFHNDLHEIFPVVDRRSYEKRFTSSAYQRFPYNAIFAFYFTSHPEKKKKEFGPYPARILPDEILELPAGSQGQLYVPFELLSIGSRIVRLTCAAAGVDKRFYYRAIRADREK